MEGLGGCALGLPVGSMEVVTGVSVVSVEGAIAFGVEPRGVWAHAAEGLVDSEERYITVGLVRSVTCFKIPLYGRHGGDKGRPFGVGGDIGLAVLGRQGGLALDLDMGVGRAAGV